MLLTTTIDTMSNENYEAHRDGQIDAMSERAWQLETLGCPICKAPLREVSAYKLPRFYTFECGCMEDLAGNVNKPCPNA